MENVVIREIKKEDNSQVAQVIRTVLVEFGVPKIGTVYEDKALDDMYAHYNVPKATYFVVQEGKKSLVAPVWPNWITMKEMSVNSKKCIF
jgi:hypothetical protein